jgi:phosphoribosylaminoimidazole-succinocarboxamide synthase
MKLYRRGKVKDVYEVDHHLLEFVFTDKISVFDKIIPSTIPHKGETLCRSSAFWFQMLRNMGIKSHFTELIPPNRMRVKKVDIISDYSKITSKSCNYLIPLEVICRHYVAGSLFDRVSDGTVTPKELGFPAKKKVAYGDELPEPMLEVTTKLEKVDRPLTKAQAMKMAALTKSEYDNLLETVRKIDAEIADEVEQRDLIHVDGKKEFAFDEERELMIVDSFGTADEDRWWDWADVEKGKFTELSKENVRQYYRKLGYYDKLKAARSAGKREPDIPALPANKIKEVSRLYIDMFERITGESY